MSKITITEGLAEIKTIDKRIGKKQEFILSHLYRQEALKDPLEKQGGSIKAIEQEFQSIKDLEERKLTIRRAIQKANEETEVSINGETRTIADWLVWRREVSPNKQNFITQLINTINQVRNTATQKGFGLVFEDGKAQNPQDFIVHFNEKQASEDAEKHEETLGTLDGQLSLKNATVMIEI